MPFSIDWRGLILTMSVCPAWNPFGQIEKLTKTDYDKGSGKLWFAGFWAYNVLPDISDPAQKTAHPCEHPRTVPKAWLNDNLFLTICLHTKAWCHELE